jgi:putative isomerase
MESLHNRIDLINVPFTERGSRLILGRKGDRLYIRMTERWEKYGGSLSAFRQHPPIIQNLAFVNANGSLLLLETDTYPYLARMKSPVGAFDWTFTDAETLLIRLPAGQFGIEFDAEVKRGTTDRRGGIMRGIRNIIYTTNADITQNEITALNEDRYRVRIMLDAKDGEVLLLNITPRLGFNRNIPAPDQVFAAAQARWEKWFSAVPPVADDYRDQYMYAWWVMGQGLLNQRFYFTREALVPSKMHYIGVWLWDQSFHALAYRHVDSRLAEDQLRIMLDHQQENGMLPDAIHDEGAVIQIVRPIEGVVTKPPIMAWSALKLYETSGNVDFLDEIYEPLTRWHDWWLRDNMNENGLCEYKHPFSSGLDDSPLWDAGMPVVAPDLNTYLHTQMESLARIAELIGLPNDAAMYQEKAAAWLQRMIDVLWNEELGVFDFLHNGERLNVLTPFHLLPLCTGKLPANIVDRLVAHLTDPATFWSQWPLPTVAINEPTFNAMQMWRGPMWPNINYLFVEGLEKGGRPEIAAQLRRKTLLAMQQHRDIYEYYNSLTAERPPKAAPIFGWSSAVFIDLAIQESAVNQK